MTLMLIEFGYELPQDFTLEEYANAVEDGLNLLAESNSGATLTTYETLCEWNIEKELFGEEFTDFEVESVAYRIKHCLVPGTLILVDADVFGEVISTMDGTEYDSYIESNTPVHLFRPKNWRECLEMEIEIIKQSIGVCAEESWNHRHHYIGYVECQEQLDWGLCPEHYHLAIKQLMMFWGEILSREIDPLYDLRWTAIAAQVEGWTRWSKLWPMIQSCNDATQLQKYIQDAYEESRRALAYWQAYQ